MRGQRLHTRPAEPADFPAITRLLGREPDTAGDAAESQLIGKLVGDIVAVARIRADDRGRLAIVDLVVDSRLRGLRIGHQMIDAIEARTRAEGRSAVVVDASRPGADFFRGAGFKEEGGELVRHVAQPG